MPYIPREIRNELDEGKVVQTSGELTYAIQQLLRKYLVWHGVDYANLASCLGALEGAKLDLITRIINPYEEKKCKENGDVWPLNLLPNITEIPYA